MPGERQGAEVRAPAGSGLSGPTSIMIIELDQALAELEDVILTGEGFEVTATVCSSSSLQQVLASNPDVIVLDLGPHTKACGWQLLEDLRTNPNTQGIPLLVVSDTEQLLEQAKLNFDVRRELRKPYDISDFISGVRSAVSGTAYLPHPAPPPTTGSIFIAAAQTISRRGGAIMAAWLRQVQQEKALGAPSNVPARVLMDNISVWIMELVSILRYGSGQTPGRSDIHAKLTDHIRDAQKYGANLVQTIRQFEILRNEVWQTLHQSDLGNLTTDDVFRLAHIVNTALDEVIVQVAELYNPPAPPRASSKRSTTGSAG